MSDTGELELRVLTEGMDEANRKLDDLAKKGNNASRASDGLMSSFKKMLVPLVSVAAVMKTLSSAVDMQRRYDQLSSTLTTVTGSAEDAAEVFKILQQYADSTPFAIESLNEAFIKLVNYGLDPSERALTSYGNTATSLGKDITDMVNAVANATTGNFQSLQSFGIRTKNMGDQVAFTFRGTTTTVKNSAAEIEEYLLSLGENDFAGAMENSLGKLDDTILALGEQWDTLLLNVMQAGLGEAIQESVQVGVDALVELNAMFASGEVEAYLESMTVQFKDWGDDISRTVEILTNFLNENFGMWEDEGEGAIKFLIDAFSKFPSNVRAFIQLMTVEVAAGLDQVISYSTAFVQSVKAIFTDTTFASIGENLDKELAASRGARKQSIEDILAERDASVKASDDMIAKAKELRAAYDAEMARDKGDRLARFKIQGDTSTKEDPKAKKRQQDEFQRLVDSLRTEEEAIRDSYIKRKAIIEKNTADGSEARADLMARLDKDNAEQLEKLRESQGAELENLRRSLLTQEEAIKESYERRLKIILDNTQEGDAREKLSAKLQKEYDDQLSQLETSKQRERDSLYSGLLTEEEMILQSYERRKALILESTAVTEEERLDLSMRLEEQYSKEMADMENKRLQTQLGNAAALFDGLSGLAAAYSGEQSKAYKVLFAISKAFSVAQAGMSIVTGMAKAQELGWPANMAEMARVGATGASLLAQLNGSNFAGAYDKGGVVPAGKIGLVGEYGPELIEGPAKITSRAETAKMLRSEEKVEASAPPVVNVRNINVLDPAIVGDYLATDEGEQMIMNVVQRNQNAIGY